MNHNYLQNSIVSKLFVRRKEDHLSNNDNVTYEFKERRCQSLAEYFAEICKCRCFVQSRTDRAFAKARDQLRRETSIVELIRSQRFINNAMKELLPKKQIRRLFAKSYRLVVDDEREGLSLMKGVDPEHAEQDLPYKVEEQSDILEDCNPNETKCHGTSRRGLVELAVVDKKRNSGDFDRIENRTPNDIDIGRVSPTFGGNQRVQPGYVLGPTMASS